MLYITLFTKNLCYSQYPILKKYVIYNIKMVNKKNSIQIVVNIQKGIKYYK